MAAGGGEDEARADLHRETFAREPREPVRIEPRAEPVRAGSGAGEARARKKGDEHTAHGRMIARGVQHRQCPEATAEARRVARCYPNAASARSRRCFVVRTPSKRSPCVRTRSSTTSIVNESGSRSSFTSSHRKGVETGAPGRGRTE